MGAYFITGTGTDIGKTWLTCALLRHWRDAGREVQAFKPVLSGFDMATVEASDAGKILAALGRKIDVAALDEIAPWRFVTPLSPDMAAAREGRRVDFEALVGFTRRCLPPKGNPRHAEHASVEFLPTLVEGVGGVMVPLDAEHTVRDWIAASDLPCVLVAGSYLGSLSHTLTALEALQKVGAGVTAIVVNESPESPVSLAETMVTLRHHVGGVKLVSISRAMPQSGVAALAFLLG
ncbi:MAG: dethiobiotin synthase [Rugosibacter sp.]|nr:dethiobiotin synthase [Rugosibacter sp.]